MHGVRAELRVEAAPNVESGHVAGWVGVGGFGAGPRGADEWIQVGVVSFEDDAVRLYYEVTRPGRPPRYVELDIRGHAPRSIRIAVVEVRGRPSWWRVWINRRAIDRPVYLPGSHGAWRPTVTAESWSGEAAACNRFGYRFDRVRVIPRGHRSWQPAAGGALFRDPGYRIVRARDSFTAFGPA